MLAGVRVDDTELGETITRNPTSILRSSLPAPAQTVPNAWATFPDVYPPWLVSPALEARGRRQSLWLVMDDGPTSPQLGPDWTC
jgi:hypothetical protein